MFLKTKTEKSMKDFSDKIKLLSEKIKAAEAVVIGAGSGLSTSAGFTYSGERFEKYFSDFEAEYGFHDMYSGGFYPFDTLEEYWAYWSRFIYVNRYTDPPKPVYKNLLEIAKDKNYFVLTTNVDHCFQKAGFDKERLFYTQGDYGLFQYSGPCRKETYDNLVIVTDMIERQENFKIPSELIPKCPHCGRPMTMNLRSDDTFAEDEGWRAASERYHGFLSSNITKKILFLELGVGYNTPGIIKYPFLRMTYQNPASLYACINAASSPVPKEILSRSIPIKADINKALVSLLNIL